MISKVLRFIILFSIPIYFALSGTSGKLSITIKDSKTNEALVGANVTIVETNLGNVSNFEGLAIILNVSPSTYKIRVSMLGYASIIVENVRVNIDQTTNLEVSLTEENISYQEVVIVAERPVVQKMFPQVQLI